MKNPLFYSQLFNALPAANLVVLPDYPTFTIIEVNDAFETLAKLPKESLIGQGIFDAFRDKGFNHEPTLNEVFLAVIRDKKPYKLPIKDELAPTDADGIAPRDPHSVSTPLFNDTNEVECIIYTIRSEERRVGKECKTRWQKDT